MNMAIMLAKNDIFYHVLFEYLKNVVKKNSILHKYFSNISKIFVKK